MVLHTQEKTNNALESQRALFREMRPQTRHFVIERRVYMLNAVHGEVHGGVEYGQQSIHWQDKTTVGPERSWSGVILRLWSEEKIWGGHG